MQGNDLDSSPTRRMWVLSDVVFGRERTEVEEKKWFRTTKKQKVVTTVHLGVMNKLWRYSATYGVRLELVFVGPDVPDAVSLWEMLERDSANPFSDWQAFENYSALTSKLPYRADILGVIDIPTRGLFYGGKYMTIDAIP